MSTDLAPAVDAAAVLSLIDPAAEVRYRSALAREAAMAERERSWSEGYAAAVADIKRAQHQLVGAVRLGLARMAPGGAAWLAAVVRNGSTEYGGRDKPRVSVPPEVIARAWQQQSGVKR